MNAMYLTRLTILQRWLIQMHSNQGCQDVRRPGRRTSSRRRGRLLKSGLRQLYPGIKARVSSRWGRFRVSVLRMAVPTGGRLPARPPRRPLAVGIAVCPTDDYVSWAAVRQLDRTPDEGGRPYGRPPQHPPLRPPGRLRGRPPRLSATGVPPAVPPAVRQAVHAAVR